MAKQAGMGANYYVAGYDLSGDTNEITSIHGGPKPWETPDITQSAMSRLGLQREGEIQWKSFFDPSATGEHAALSGLPRTDVIATCFLNPLAIGSPAVSCNSLLVQAETKRANAGELNVDYTVQSDGFGIEWGLQLTPGKRTDSAATNGASNNDGAATNFGAQFYLQVFSFAGTDATVVIQDSADNASFANVTGGSFAQITSATPSFQRISISNVSTLRQYVRAITTTVGGFSSLVFAVQYSRNPVAGVVF